MFKNLNGKKLKEIQLIQKLLRIKTYLKRKTIKILNNTK